MILSNTFTTDSQHQNPLNKVVTGESLDKDFGLEYDSETDAAETTLGIFGFDRTLYGKPKDKKWWMQLRRKRMKSSKPKSHSSTEIVVCHKVKRIFVNVVDMDKENPDEILICEFGQNFELVAD